MNVNLKVKKNSSTLFVIYEINRYFIFNITHFLCLVYFVMFHDF